MRSVHESTVDFSPAALRLFCAVAEAGSISAGGATCGLTQSAATRQLQRLETEFGAALFERTTRSLRLTAAGAFLLPHARRLLGDAAHTLRRLREEFAGAARQLRVGVSRSIGISHLPGLLHAFEARHADTMLALEQAAGAQLLQRLGQRALDLAVVSRPARLPAGLEIAHSFRDEFVFLAPRRLGPPAAKPRSARQLVAAWRDERWILPVAGSGAGGELREWLRALGLRRHHSMELDSFEVAASLVMLGLGVSIVPRRTLALFARGRRPPIHEARPRFVREVAVVVRQELPRAPQIDAFVEAIAFRR